MKYIKLVLLICVLVFLALEVNIFIGELTARQSVLHDANEKISNVLLDCGVPFYPKQEVIGVEKLGTRFSTFQFRFLIDNNDVTKIISGLSLVEITNFEQTESEFKEELYDLSDDFKFLEKHTNGKKLIQVNQDGFGRYVGYRDSGNLITLIYCVRSEVAWLSITEK